RELEPEPRARARRARASARICVRAAADDPDRRLREDRRRRARRGTAADSGGGRAQSEQVDPRLRVVEHRVLDCRLSGWNLRADALRSAAAVGRGDHSRGGADIRGDDDHSHGSAALSRGNLMNTWRLATLAAAALLSAAAWAQDTAPLVLTGTQAT